MTVLFGRRVTRWKRSQTESRWARNGRRAEMVRFTFTLITQCLAFGGRDLDQQVPHSEPPHTSLSSASNDKRACAGSLSYKLQPVMFLGVTPPQLLIPIRAPP